MVDPDPLPGLELPLPLRALLRRRGFRSVEEAKQFLIPTSLPEAELHFPDLKKATNRLVEACQNNEAVAICGDYDADGMTSTASFGGYLDVLPEPIALRGLVSFSATRQ